jgi:hypothetical protein
MTAPGASSRLEAQEQVSWPFVFAMLAASEQVHRSSVVTFVDFESVVHVQDNVAPPIIVQPVHVAVYEPPAIPQQLSTPLMFEISFTTGQLHRSSVASANVDELVAHEHVSVPPVTEQLPHVEVYEPDGVPHETGASTGASATASSAASPMGREGASSSPLSDDSPIVAGGPPS